ncbi:MAG: hypothetical protein WBE83_15925 [Candidatus Cybelea sp.]
MLDVADEVLDLPLGKWPRRPIADGLRFRQTHAADAAHEVGERDLHTVTEKRRRDLRIEDARRHEIVTVGEDLQVGGERVTDDRRLRQSQHEFPQIAQGERVDDRRAFVEGELNDHQPRRVRAFGVELGVQRNACGIANLRAEVREGGRIGDDGGRHGEAEGSARRRK